ncbi:hypothetical protein I4Z71_005005 [Salmonella enterica subsp. enterica serovar Grumpensis]|nr:hypothetical protein [Salmonella enterica subsp. enterica serovar Grumpensis]EGR9572930.1 hypothetical protein [Salmonella enterica subsp. enterica serovar Grumpensis]
MEHAKENPVSIELTGQYSVEQPINGGFGPDLQQAALLIILHAYLNVHRDLRNN